MTAAWWKNTSIYQIYPRSYQDSNGDGIGDLQGIISRLDYIAELGFETIWISPFFSSPQGDFGYDISDYYGIAPEFGSMADTEELIAKAHAKGLKVVLDMVLNHTSEKHPWFLESSLSKDNPKADWYLWHDGKGKDGKKPPNNWTSIPAGNGWQYSESRGQWYFCSFLPFQPDLNYRNPEVKEAMLSVLRFWLQKGADGFRLDIFNAIFIDPDYSKKNPFSFHWFPTKDMMRARFQKRIHTINHPDNFAFAKEVRSVVDEFPGDRFLVGEVFGAHPVVRNYLGEQQEGLNLIFLFDMTLFQFNANFFRNQIETYNAFYPAPYVPTFVTGNHDYKRSIGRVRGNLTKAALLAVLQMTFRGVPVCYNGEEIGMLDADIDKKEALDPISHAYWWVPNVIRKLLPIPLNRDEVRTPMQWTAEKHAGFCPNNVKPWLPLASGDLASRNVQTQRQNDKSLHATYTSLLKLRKAHSALQSGSQSLHPILNSKTVLAYWREDKTEKLLVACNFSAKSTTIKLEPKLEAIWSSVDHLTPKSDSPSTTLPPFGSLVLKSPT